MTKEYFMQVYERIQQCNYCGTTNSDKVLRKIDYVNCKSKIFIIAEAMAPSQVRVSGINYFDINNKLGLTGKSLEKFLSIFKHSVYPDKNCVYSTEIVHCFPGYEIKESNMNIRRPSQTEIKNCIKKGFIQNEIELVKPKIIFLMGRTSYLSFYKYFLNTKTELNLTEKIKNITETKRYEEYNDIPIIPIQHASTANPRFNQMLKNHTFINIINKILT
jgi:uracil-DNA glycosylase family 4